jgi:anti-sigma factor (TIGR02949 family)
MKCETVERHLDAYVDGEVDPNTQIDFDEHLAVCAPCQESVGIARATKAHVHSALSGVAAPSALRQRILAGLDSVDAERASTASAAGHLLSPAQVAAAAASHDHVSLEPEGGFRIRVLHVPARVAVPLAAAAALLLAVLGSLDLRLGGSSGVDQAAMPVFEDVVKLHSASLPADVQGAEPQKVATYFRDKVRFPVQPMFDSGEAQLVGARLSNVRDRRAAALYYNVRGNRLTVVVFEDPSSEDPVGVHTRYHGKDVFLTQVGGYTVPVVRRGPVTYAFTGDVDKETLLRLAVAARVQ